MTERSPSGAEGYKLRALLDLAERESRALQSGDLVEYDQLAGCRTLLLSRLRRPQEPSTMKLSGLLREIWSRNLHDLRGLRQKIAAELDVVRDSRRAGEGYGRRTRSAARLVDTNG